ncbi:unnamed protein product [Lymnaea stagnalis]|uniref:G-protein coupled receptors family 3 profile domain-containing protein n=1 Tax=Lymnaea stagnalis TaxID=6523 RepID=A0AAV2GYH1_LYMST
MGFNYSKISTCLASSRAPTTSSITFLLLMMLTSDQINAIFTAKDPKYDKSPGQVNAVQIALGYVKAVETSKCTGGTGEVLQLKFDHTPWIQYTEPAIRTANLLNGILALDGNLSRIKDDMFYAMVRNNVHGKSLVYGSAIAVEPNLIPGKTKFCPYAYINHTRSTVTAIDIAIHYDYQTNTTEWYRGVALKNRSAVVVAQDVIRRNDTEKQLIQQPGAVYEDGYWTNPYFDCGGGDIWMSTYSSPILYRKNGTLVFGGVATIDIELTNIDINQCDLGRNESAKALDIFRGTHSCQPTTVCVPLNQGFKAGSYICQCQDGYYFPNMSATVKAFRGIDIETYIRSSNISTVTGKYQCIQCSRGCDTCDDSTPCMYQINFIVQSLITIIISVLIVGCVVIAVIVFKYRKQLVMKTASPIFLLLMCAGAVLMCGSVFTLYGEVSSLSCTIQIWPFHLGFIVMYGALILKTWRISLIFKSGGAKTRINLPDKALLQRMLPLVALVAVYLTVWTAIDPPVAYTVKSSHGLKFFVCSMTWWKYSFYGVEAFLLLIGVYLCFTVRKAPAHFNESKYITWATYNAIILGSFIIMLTQFVGFPAGPDVVFLLMMLQQQVFVTITMSLIFIPKLFSLYRGQSEESTVYSNNNVVTITGRLKPSSAVPSSASGDVRSDMKCVAVQCRLEDFYAIPGYREDDAKHHTTVKFTSRVTPMGTPVLTQDNAVVSDI